MSQPNIIQPNLPTGFRDYNPSEMIARNAMLRVVSEVFELHGFDPLDLSAVERADVVGAEAGGAKQMFCAAKPEEIIGEGADSLSPKQRTLRFDLTVGLARYVAANWDSGEIPRPFKRWQLGRVWRGERPQKGRFREFYQCDIDTVGSASMLADAEIIMVMSQVLTKLEVGGFTISINNRKLLNGLPDLAGYEAALNSEVLIILDKIDKIGVENVREELAEAIGLSGEQIDKVMALQHLPTDSADAFLDAATTLFAGVEIAESGVADLRELVGLLRANGVAEEQWKIDPSIARGLGYYTGTIFETKLNDLPEIGSVMSGGRYDGLVARFRKGEDLPAVGASIGLARLLVALQELGRLSDTKTVTVATILPETENDTARAMQILRVLHDAGVNAQVYMGTKKDAKRIKEIQSNGVPFVVFADSNSETVRVRNLSTGDNTDSSLDQLPNAFA